MAADDGDEPELSSDEDEVEISIEEASLEEAAEMVAVVVGEKSGELVVVGWLVVWAARSVEAVFVVGCVLVELGTGKEVEAVDGVAPMVSTSEDVAAADAGNELEEVTETGEKAELTTVVTVEAMLISLDC